MDPPAQEQVVRTEEQGGKAQDAREQNEEDDQARRLNDRIRVEAHARPR